MQKELVFNREAIFVERPPYPKNMLISLNNSCNHQCVFCAYRKSEFVRTSIEKFFLFDIMQQAYDLGTREIGLYSTAEPFTSKILEEVILKAHHIGFEYIYLTTNGSIATPERLEAAFKNGLNSIKFSINAGNAKSYLRIHGKNDFDKVIENIKAAYELKRKINPDMGIFVSFIECSFNAGENVVLEELLSPYIDHFYTMQGINQGGNMFEELQQGIIERTNMKKCDMVFNRFHITPEGFLTACCVDFENCLVVADLNRMTLKEAWNCEAFVALRKQHLSGKMDENLMCYNCLNNTNHAVIPVAFDKG